jgi:hypothetical protein
VDGYLIKVANTSDRFGFELKLENRVGEVFQFTVRRREDRPELVRHILKVIAAAWPDRALSVSFDQAGNVLDVELADKAEH